VETGEGEYRSALTALDIIHDFSSHQAIDKFVGRKFAAKIVSIL
jgi:hypothetical protein